MNVVSLTFDDAIPNLAMMKNLGCNLDPENIRSYFAHPVTGKPVCVFLDPCHMFKLVRNSLGDLGKILDPEGNTVEWRFIVSVHHLPEKEGLHLGNKLRASHNEYVK